MKKTSQESHLTPGQIFRWHSHELSGEDAIEVTAHLD